LEGSDFLALLDAGYDTDAEFELRLRKHFEATVSIDIEMFMIVDNNKHSYILLSTFMKHNHLAVILLVLVSYLR